MTRECTTRKDGNRVEEARVVDIQERLIRRLSIGAYTGSNAASSPWHIFSLCRGWTTGTIEDLVCSEDARWVAFGTRKRTAYVFSTNPYCGKLDEARDLERRVRNVSIMVENLLCIVFFKTDKQTLPDSKPCRQKYPLSCRLNHTYMELAYNFRA
jgi:hypothetical protein